MKKCQPCGAMCPANAPHCARCGEASWAFTAAPPVIEYKGRGMLTPEQAAPFENALPWPPVAAAPVLVPNAIDGEDASPPKAPPIVIEGPAVHVAAPEPVQAPVLVPSAPKSPAPAKHRKRDR